MRLSKEQKIKRVKDLRKRAADFLREANLLEKELKDEREKAFIEGTGEFSWLDHIHEIAAEAERTLKDYQDNLMRDANKALKELKGMGLLQNRTKIG